jgi:hypothetical protein
MPNHPRGPNMIVGTKEEIMSVRFVVLPGSPAGTMVQGSIYKSAEHEHPTNDLIIPDGYIYHPSYIEVDAEPRLPAELVCKRNGEVVFGGSSFGLTRIALDESGIVEVEEPLMFKHKDRMEFYLKTVTSNGSEHVLEEVLVHMIEVPDTER